MKYIPDAKTVEKILERVCERANAACESVDFWTEAEKDEGCNAVDYRSYHEARKSAEGELFAFNSLANELTDLLCAIETIKNF